MALKIMITGSDGMLGRTLQRQWRDFDLVPVSRRQEDVTDLLRITNCILRVRPDAVLHAAAMTNVDDCESSPDRAFRVNAGGAANVAFACQKAGSRMIHISTDYVFSGEGNRPWTEDDETHPVNLYGRSKLAGEEAVRRIIPDNHLIVRTAWLYGPGENNFLRAMLRLADGSRPELKVVSDQIGNPTSTDALAKVLHHMVLQPQLCGTFHASCEGECSRYDFAQEIFRCAGVDQKISPCTTAEYPRPAQRPRYSSLAKLALRDAGLAPMPDWREALSEFFHTRH